MEELAHLVSLPHRPLNTFVLQKPGKPPLVLDDQVKAHIGTRAAVFYYSGKFRQGATRLRSSNILHWARSHCLDKEESAMASQRWCIFFEDLGLWTRHKSTDIPEKLFFPSLLTLFGHFLISDPKRHTTAAMMAKGYDRKEFWGKFLFLPLGVIGSYKIATCSAVR
jgi:hypothetical protein